MTTLANSQKNYRAAKRIRRVAIAFFIIAAVEMMAGVYFTIATGGATGWLLFPSAIILIICGFSMLTSADSRELTARQWERLEARA